MMIKSIQLLWPLFDTHGTGWMPVTKARNFNLFPYGTLTEDFYFLQVAHWVIIESSYLDEWQWIAEVWGIYKVPFIIWEHGKPGMWGLNISAMPKVFHLLYFIKLFPWMKRIWGWTWGITCERKHGELPVLNNSRVMDKREEELAEHKDCLSSQLYNVTPIMKKLSTLPAKTNITTNHWQVCAGCSRWK